MIVFRILLALAGCICLAGIIRRYAKHIPDVSSPTLPANSPVHSPFKAALQGLCALFADALLLRRTARTSLYRWIAHTLIFVGFMGLLIFHALDDIISYPLISGYESTLNPWQWLRNLFGIMVLAGTGLAVMRRFRNRLLYSLTRPQDWLLVAIISTIMLSGFLLEASKIISPNVFNRMTESYFIPENDTDISALQAYWSAHNGIIFSPAASTEPTVIATGAELSANNCNYCHADTSSAFISRALATAISPAADPLNAAHADSYLWYLHIGLALLALALMPYGKFMHPVATPLNLVARHGKHNAGYDETTGHTTAAKKLGLEACTRCGECSLHCSVAPAFSVIGNANILPSEKLLSLREYASGNMPEDTIDAFAEGSRICTECLRCTDICPSGINLQDLWLSSKRSLAQKELDSPNTTIRQCNAMQWSEVLSAQGKSRFEQIRGNGLADRAESFWGCVQCTTCTSVCPVVAVSEAPAKDLDLTPQQIMNLLRMGLKDQTLAARMVWSCTTCYKCQEHCPQNIQVADILFELRQIATERLKDRKLTACPLPSATSGRFRKTDNAPTGTRADTEASKKTGKEADSNTAPSQPASSKGGKA